MRIAVDIQALQTVGSRDRGIGQYTFQLLKTLLEIDSENEYLLICNASLEPPKINGLPSHRLINLSYPSDHHQISEIITEMTLLMGKIDIFHIASPMEMTDAIIPRYMKSLPFQFVCTLYDLIPYLFQDHYLSNYAIKELYHYRLCSVKQADHIFAISECSRQDAIKYLSIPAERISNIGAGINPHFRSPLRDNLFVHWREHLQRKFNIKTKFVLYTGGADWRKNIEGLIQAFSKLHGSLLEKYQLVICCKLEPAELQYYIDIGHQYSIDKKLILTNFVSQEELHALYSLCSLFVFPSLYEGFGLPLVEAMACGAPVITSEASSLPEVVEDAGIQVAPGSIAQLTEAMTKVLIDEQLRAEMSRRSREQAKKFSWEIVATKVLNVYKQLGPRFLSSFNFKRICSSAQDMPKIALFSPVNPIRSGISDYTEDLLPYLCEHFKVDLYLDSSYRPNSEFISKKCCWYEHYSFEKRIEEENYLAILYQLGNSSYHAYMINYIMKYGGIITLHDYSLGGLINWLSCELLPGSQNRLDLFEELIYGYGEVRAKDAFQKMQHGRLWPHELFNENLFLNKRFFDRSIGMVVHSQWAYERARNDILDYPQECLRHIPQGVPFVQEPTAEEIRSIRNRLGIPRNALVIAVFGIIDFPKRVTSIIKAFDRLAKKNRRARLLFVGECQPGYTEPMQLIDMLNLGDKVCITGYVELKSFYDYMKACDIVLNLRYPTQGETSATLLRALSLGKPAIVSNGAAFTDFPDSVVLKVIYGPNDEDDITEKLILLSEETRLRHRMGENARSHVIKYHSMNKVSEEYIDFIFKCVQHESTQLKLIADLAGQMLVNAGVSPHDHHSVELVAQAIARMRFEDGDLRTSSA